MSLKSLINALFKLSGGQAMPSDDFVNTTINSMIGDFTAPQDGYIALRNPNGGYNRISLCNGNVPVTITIDAGSGWASGWYAVRKGQIVGYRIDNFSEALIVFCHSVGGG